MGIFSNLFSSKPKRSLSEMKSAGAVVIDVRTKAEFAQGHIKDSKNIPLDQLEKGVAKIKKDQAIITCCASGMRSRAAVSRLKALGFTDVENGGGWSSLQREIRS